MFADLSSAGALWWYAHIATCVSLLVFLFVGALPAAKVIVGIFRPDTGVNYRRVAYASGILLVGGMIHTDYTVLWLQFVSYGGLLLAMLLRALSSGTSRTGVSGGRLTISYLYVLCFSMAIPVVYDTAVQFAAAFTAIEIVTSLLLVLAFAVMLDGYLTSGGLVNFNAPLITFTLAADAALLALRWTETVNWFLLVFPVLALIFWVIGRTLYGNHQLLSFYGYRHGKSYFEGWYFKLQKDTDVLAFIVSYHADSSGKQCAMLQVVTDGDPISFKYPIEAFDASEDRLRVRLGDSSFDEYGMTLNVDSDGHCVRGRIEFGKFLPLRNDIMGLFANLPFMKCKHGVVSMRHAVCGSIDVDGRRYDMDGGIGYIEKDRGGSFPSEYHWTQATDGKNSVMLAVASVPYFGITFTGCIGVFQSEGNEYRFATYNGARVEECTADKLVITRGKRKLSVTAIEKSTKPLAAPESGEMSRTIHESPSATVEYELTEGGSIAHAFVSKTAGYETGE